MKVNQFDPYLGPEEIKLVNEAIERNWITEGAKTELFQNQLKEYTKAKHVILLPNGTLALYVALMIADIGPGDEVVVPAFTFVGSATSVVLTGAKPVFCDVNKDDFNISVESLKKCLSKKTKAIMPVHIHGQAARMDEVMAIAKSRRLKVIEDAAQGLGVTFGNQHVGTFGEIGCVSFYADKTLTMGEGGAIFTNSDRLAERCMYFKNQGRLKRGSFVHPHMGFNFRITDLQAAVGVAQMAKLSHIIARKHQMEGLYKSLLKDTPEVKFPIDTKVGKRIPFRINILVKNPKALGDYLIKQDVGVRRFFYPLYKQPCFNKTNCRILSSYPVSDYLFMHGLSLPSGVGLTDEQIQYVCEKIKEYYA